MINALRMGTRSIAPRKRINWEALFGVIHKDLSKKSTLSNTAIWGLSAAQLCGRVGVARRWLQAKHAITIDLSLPWRDRKRVNIELECRRLEKLLLQPGQVAILGFITKHHSHWSVIRRINDRYIILSDSNGLGRLTIAKIGFNAEEKFTKGKTVIVSGEDLLLLKVCRILE